MGRNGLRLSRPKRDGGVKLGRSRVRAVRFAAQPFAAVAFLFPSGKHETALDPRRKALDSGRRRA
jgi:hypothetical protein